MKDTVRLRDLRAEAANPLQPELNKRRDGFPKKIIVQRNGRTHGP